MTSSADILRLEAALTGAIRIPWCPQSPHPAQLRFLRLTCREALYGGAAGGGKSSALLMAAMQYAHVPGYAALILRRTIRDMKLPNSILDRAKSWFRPHASAGVTFNAQDNVFTFPCVGGGHSTLQFGYCEHDGDEEGYQGAELQYIGIDELGQWKQRPYIWLNSRLRRLKGTSVPIRIRAGTNPGGIGHRWIKRRFVDPGDPSRPFIPAKLTDNPTLDVDEYRASLAVLDTTTRDQLEHGLWVDDTTGRVYKYADGLHGVDVLPVRDRWHTALGIDLGTSESKPTTAFALVLWHDHDPTAYVARSWKRAGMTPTTIAEEVQNVTSTLPDCRLVMDLGGLGAGYAKEIRVRHQLPIVAAQKRDKLGFRKLMNGEFETGKLKVLRPSCEDLIAEYETLVWNEKGTDAESSTDDEAPTEKPGLDDHCSDAALYAWREARSYAHTEAPLKKPPYGSDEWFRQREAEAIRREEAEWDSQKTALDCETW